jgi:hypothetical protein
LITTKKKKPRAKGKYYVDNKEFYKALVEYKKVVATAKTPPSIPNYIGDCISLICNKLAIRPNFYGYSFRSEMVGEAILNCFEAIGNFDPDRFTNPFGYFTQIAWYAFLRKIEQEDIQHYTMHANLENMFLGSDEIFAEMKGDDSSKDDGIRRHYEVIQKFEDKLERKKNRQKANKK